MKKRLVLPGIALAAAAIGYVAGASNVSTPHTFVAGTPAVANEVNANFAAHENAINDNDARISDLEAGAAYTVVTNLNSFASNLTNAYVRVTDQETFTKEAGGTRIEASFHSRIYSGVFAGGATGVLVELRVDDLPASVFIRGVTLPTSTANLAHAFALFEGLTAGSHTVSLWARTNAGTSTTFGVDPGGWGGAIMIKEVQ